MFSSLLLKSIVSFLQVSLTRSKGQILNSTTKCCQLPCNNVMPTLQLISCDSRMGSLDTLVYPWFCRKWEGGLYLKKDVGLSKKKKNKHTRLHAEASLWCCSCPMPALRARAVRSSDRWSVIFQSARSIEQQQFLPPALFCSLKHQPMDVTDMVGTGSEPQPKRQSQLSMGQPGGSWPYCRDLWELWPISLIADNITPWATGIDQ